MDAISKKEAEDAKEKAKKETVAFLASLILKLEHKPATKAAIMMGPQRDQQEQEQWPQPCEAQAQRAQQGPAPMTWAAIYADIAQTRGMKPKAIKGIFCELKTLAASEVAKNKKFVLPKLVTLTLQLKPKRKASRRRGLPGGFVPARAARKVLKAFASKALNNSIAYLQHSIA